MRGDAEFGKEYRRLRPVEKLETFSAVDLLSKEFPPVQWAVPELIPEGVTILGGRPKIGKSWFALGACMAVAAGGRAFGKVAVEKGTALYLALEDNERRLQRRTKHLLHGEDAPPNLHFRLDWPQVGEGGADALDSWLGDHPDARLVVIDTLKKIRPRATTNRSIYDVDYEALEPMIPIASSHGVSILVVHHLRKMGADDPLDELSGSTGLSGGVDGAAILKRGRNTNEATLFVTGRDLEEEKEVALTWDRELASWTLEGDAEEFRMHEERKRILDLLRGADGPVAAKDIAEELEKNASTTRVLLSKMARDGQVDSLRGKGYVIPEGALWS